MESIWQSEHFLHTFAGVTALVVGLMAGNELAVALFFHPALYRLPDAEHAPAAKALAGRLGRVMPAWYGASFVLSALLAWRLRNVGALSFHLVAASAGVSLAAIVCTVFFLVPINNRIAAWNLAALPPTWRRDRETWDGRHRWRVAALIVGFGLLTSGLMGLPLR